MQTGSVCRRKTSAFLRAAQGKGLVPGQHGRSPAVLQIRASLPEDWQNRTGGYIRRARAPSESSVALWCTSQSVLELESNWSLFARKLAVSFINTKISFCLLFQTAGLANRSPDRSSLALARYSRSVISQQNTHFAGQVKYHKTSVSKSKRETGKLERNSSGEISLVQSHHIICQPQQLCKTTILKLHRILRQQMPLTLTPL